MSIRLHTENHFKCKYGKEEQDTCRSTMERVIIHMCVLIVCKILKIIHYKLVIFLLFVRTVRNYS